MLDAGRIYDDKTLMSVVHNKVVGGHLKLAYLEGVLLQARQAVRECQTERALEANVMQ